MKKILLAIGVLALITSCNNSTFNVEGTITAPDNSIVVMSDAFESSTAADTATVVNNSFQFKGEASITSVKKVVLIEPNGKASRRFKCTFIPESGKIAIQLDSLTVTGGVLNTKLNEFAANNKKLYGKLMAIYQDKSLSEMSKEEQMDAIEDEMEENTKALFTANKDNAIALIALDQVINDLSSKEEIDEYTEGAAEFVLNSEIIKKRVGVIEALQNSAVGKKFIDFPGESVDGKAISLSHYVGKGKYVLVDFWASWCGPCRREIPNLVNIHKKYGKKIIVLGVPVWDERAATDKAIEELGIKYDNLYVGNDRTSTNLYGVMGIPHIMLIAPDGTIAKRGLRGEAIEAAVKAVL
jgi:thiol-disulfide isomerase/thioredoxin